MNRAALRTLLKRQMNDVSNVDWSTSDLNDALNHGLVAVQKLVAQVAPDAVRGIVTQDITATEFFKVPDDFWYEYKIQLKQADGTYKTMRKLDYDLAEARDAGATDTTYSPFGRYIALRPIPTASLSAGIRYMYTPTLTMTLDTDVPGIHEGLHRLVMIEAALTLLPETGEATKELRAASDRERGDIALWYRTGGTIELLNFDGVNKGY